MSPVHAPRAGSTSRLKRATRRISPLGGPGAGRRDREGGAGALSGSRTCPSVSAPSGGRPRVLLRRDRSTVRRRSPARRRPKRAAAHRAPGRARVRGKAATPESRRIRFASDNPESMITPGGPCSADEPGRQTGVPPASRSVTVSRSSSGLCSTCAQRLRLPAVAIVRRDVRVTRFTPSCTRARRRLAGSGPVRRPAGVRRLLVPAVVGLGCVAAGASAAGFAQFGRGCSRADVPSMGSSVRAELCRAAAGLPAATVP